MGLDVALELLLDRVILYTLGSLGRDMAEFEAICSLAKRQSRIVFSLARSRYLPVTEAEIDLWAIEGAAELLMRRRVGYQMSHEDLSRAFRNYLMHAYLVHSRDSLRS